VFFELRLDENYDTVGISITQSVPCKGCSVAQHLFTLVFRGRLKDDLVNEDKIGG